MFDRDRLRNFANIGVALAVLALIANSSFSIWSEYSRASQAYREYQQQTKTYEKEAADKIARLCENIIPSNPALRDCLLKGIEAYQGDETSKQDLKAQQDMALWGLWLLIVSALGLIVSVGGLWALFHSLRQTRIAIKDTRELGEVAARAYLEYQPHSFNIVTGADGSIGIAVTGKVTIVGQSYAKNISTGLWIGSHKPDFSIIPKTITLHTFRSYCAPSVVIGDVKVQAPTKNFAMDWKNSYEIWIGIVFNWEDAFSKPQAAQFRYRLTSKSRGTSISGSELLQCTENNDVAIASA